jgi:hypothetical protein
MLGWDISFSVLTRLPVAEHVMNPSFNMNSYLAVKRPGNNWFHTDVYRNGKLRFSPGLNLRRFQADESPSLPVRIKNVWNSTSTNPSNHHHRRRRRHHYIIIIIIIIIIILDISFMQGIYTYIPETNHVPREQCVEAILM